MKQAPVRKNALWTSLLSPRNWKATRTLLVAAAVIFTAPAPASAQRVLGIDVSAWQATITTDEWATFHRATNQQVNGINGDGRDFVFIRSSRGGTTGEDHRSGGYPSSDNTFTNLSQRYDDPYFVQNITRATAVGMFAGPYHFGRADIIATTGNSGGIANNGTDEANHMIETAGAWMRPGYLLPVFDLEAGISQRSSAELTAFAMEFSDRIYEVKGIRPIVYCSGNYATYMQPSIVSAFPILWTARWPNQDDPNSIPVQTMNPNDSISYIYGPWDDPPRPAQPWAFWQYASTARLNGNPGANIDVDVAHGGIEYVKDYCVPALWMANGDGLWNTLSNWNCGFPPTAPVIAPGQLPRVGTLTLPAQRLPASDDTVILDRPNTNLTITLGSGVQNIRKLYVREALNITNGSLIVNYIPSADSTPLAAQFSAPVALSGGGLNVHTLQVDATRAFTLGGGTLTFNTINLMPHTTSPAKIAMLGNVTMNPLSGATATIARGTGSGGLGFIDLSGGTRTFIVGNGSGDIDLSIDVSLGNGGLTKAGAGTMRLTAANNYSGGTTVSAGKLFVNNLAGSGTGTRDVTVDGGVLGGTGIISGPVDIRPGGTISPGTSIGTLTINSFLTLSGVTIMEVNAGTGTSDLIRGLSVVTYGGTLIISNLSGAITTSNVFKLFNANSYSGAFATLSPPAPGPGLAWNTSTLALDGTLRVVSTAIPTLTAGRTGPSAPLTLSWPNDHIGWHLQFQTNSISVGLSTNWFDIPDSAFTNQMTFPFDPTAGSVFYRLVYP